MNYLRKSYFEKQFPLFPLLGTFAQRSVVWTAVELDSVTIQDSKDASPASVSTCLPYVVYRVTGIVHTDDGLVPILAKPPLGVRLDLAAALQPLLGPAHGRGLGRQA